MRASYSVMGAVSGATLLVGLLACGNGTTNTNTVDHWLGATPHLRAEGFLKGNKVSIDLKGAAADDVTQLHCKREYFAHSFTDGGGLDYSTAVPSENKIIWKFDGGTDFVDSAEIEVKRHDFRSDSAGDAVTIVTRDGVNQPPAGSMWFEYQTNDPVTNAKTLEYGAQSGTYTHGEYDCTRDPARPAVCAAGEGDVGGFVTAVWSETDSLQVSFTAHCTVDSVEDISKATP